MVAGDAVEEIGQANDRESIGTAAVGALEKAAGGTTARIVVAHVHLTADDIEFLGEFVRGKGGVLEDVAKDVDGDAGTGVGDVDPVDGAVEGGVGVHVPASGLDLLVDATGAAGGGALEQHVFEDVREAGTEPLAFVDGSGAAPGLGADNGGGAILAEDDFKAVVETVKGHPRREVGRHAGGNGCAGHRAHALERTGRR